MDAPAVDIASLSHGFGAQPLFSIEALKIAPGERLAVIGPSGCGKTTLLGLIAGLMKPRAGSIRVLGEDMAAMDEAARDRFRGAHIGILFQRHHLIAALTLQQNLALAMSLAGRPADTARIAALLAALDLASLAQQKPATLSGGEMLRACLARALVNRPRILLADEPTSSLDDARALAVIALLQREAAANGASLIVATHDARVRAQFDRVLDLGQSGVRP